MYYTNLAYRWRVGYPLGHGVCVSAWGVNSHRALTRDSLSSVDQRQPKLFDPQLYLRELIYPDCDNAVRRLSTYEWINPHARPYDSSSTLSQWEQSVVDAVDPWPVPLATDPGEIAPLCDACIQFQTEFGVDQIILPSPLISDPQSDLSVEMRWLDCGVAAVPKDCRLPLLATIAISDSCLVHRAPPENDLLHAIADQVTAERGIDGVYVVVEQSEASGPPFIRDQKVAWSLLWLSHVIGGKLGLRVVVNYADVFGLACLACGATSFVSGPTTKSRRLCFADFQSRGGGGALPKFYSHALIMDLLPSRDIEMKLMHRRLGRYIYGDITPASGPLLAALRNGIPTDLVPDWREQVNNTSASSSHYQERVMSAAEEIAAEADPVSTCLTWLQDAERDAGYLATRCEDDPLSPDHRHIASWRSALESLIDQFSL